MTGATSLTLRLYDLEVGGAPLHVEGEPVILTQGGLFVATLGEEGGNELSPGDFAAQLYLGVTVDEAGGGTELTPRIPLRSSPYSLQAVVAEGLAPTGDVALSGFRLTNLGAPTSPGDAATKGFVDGQVGDLGALATADQSSAVAAINELDGQLGDLGMLQTTATSDLVAAINELLASSASLQTQVTELDGRTSFITVDGTEVYFDGVNLHIRDGSGDTHGPTNGLGNLIIGYDENTSGQPRGGSHNLIVGAEQSYEAFGHIKNNFPPQAQDVVPTGAGGDIDVTFDLLDSEGDPMSVVAEFRGGPFPSYTLATLTGVTTGLAPGPHSVTWASGTDAAGVEAGDFQIRVTPLDPKVGVPAESAPFAVDNNLPPVVTNVSSPGGTGDIGFTFDLADAEGDLSSVAVEYRGGSAGGTFTPATVIGSTTGLAPGTGLALTWDSEADVPGEFGTDFQLRVTPDDGDPGTPGTSPSFTVQNNSPPVVSITGTDRTSGPVVITYDLADADSSPATIVVEYRGGGAGGTYTSATVSGVTSGLTPGTGYTITWQIDQDEPAGEACDYQVRITPFDAFQGVADETSAFGHYSGLPRDSFECGELGVLAWSQTGSSNWTTQTAQVSDGARGIQATSGAYLEISLDLPTGAFAYSGARNCGPGPGFTAYLDGQVRVTDSLSHVADGFLQDQWVHFLGGPHTIGFEYSGPCTAFLDDFLVAPGFGRNFNWARELPPTIGDGSLGVTIHGGAADQFLGGSAAPAGDVNGDGYDDVLLGVPSRTLGPDGGVYLVFGGPAGPPHELDVQDLLAANGGDGSQGVVFKAEHDFDGSTDLGASMAGDVDVNGDSVDDFVLCGNECFVFFGRKPGVTTLATWPAEILVTDVETGGGTEGFRAYKQGYAVGIAGLMPDVNGDGIGDMLFSSGMILFGRSTGFPANYALLDLLPANGGDGTEGFVLGDIVARPLHHGDINGDGLSDVAAGTYNGASGGDVFVIFGRSAGFPASIAAHDLRASNGGDGSEGFVVLGTSVGVDLQRAEGAGDLDGDGDDELLLGALGADPYPGETGDGQVYVLNGRDSGFPAEIDATNIPGGDGFEVLPAQDMSDYFPGNYSGPGDGMAALGDVNGDGLADVGFKGDYTTSHPKANFTGIVLFGSDPPPTSSVNVEQITSGTGTLGFEMFSPGFMSKAGDVNGDGVEDFMVTAENWGSNDGIVAVVFGRESP